MAEYVRFTGPGNKQVAINPEKVAAITEFNATETEITLSSGAVVRVRRSFDATKEALQSV